MNVKFALLYEDNTWSTKTFDIGTVDVDNEDEVDSIARKWANDNLLGTAEYRNVVLIAVYGTESIDYDKVVNCYKSGQCPDCGTDIPYNAVEGDCCVNCGFVFYRFHDNDVRDEGMSNHD